MPILRLSVIRLIQTYSNQKIHFPPFTGKETVKFFKIENAFQILRVSPGHAGGGGRVSTSLNTQYAIRNTFVTPVTNNGRCGNKSVTIVS